MAEVKLTKYVEGSDEQIVFLKKIEKLNSIFGGEPDERFITNLQNQFNYLPISHLETLLDEYFFGHWSTVNFKYQQIANEICGDLELVVTHPITGETLTRSGAASVVIMQDAKTKLIDFAEHKKPNALVMGFPKLKAECIKNAISSLGKKFGRDLNRKIVDNYAPLYNHEPKEEIEVIRKNIIDELENYAGEDKEMIKEMCREKHEAGEFTMVFAKQICQKLNLPVS